MNKNVHLGDRFKLSNNRIAKVCNYDDGSGLYIVCYIYEGGHCGYCSAEKLLAGKRLKRG